MARAFIDDLWLKNDSDGTPPSSAARKSLANAKDPFKAKVPEKWRTTRYGKYSRWRVRWYIIATDGVKKQKVKTFALLGDAEEFKAAIEDDVRRGRYHDPSQENRLFRDVAEEWAETKLDIKPGTLGRYKRELRVYVNPRWGDLSLREIQRSDLQEWVKSLTEGDYPAELPKNRKHTRPLKPRSIRNIVKIVTGGVLGYAVENDWLTQNPLDKVVTPKIVTDDDDMVFLDFTEVELLADEATKVGSAMDGILVRFQAYTGARIGETLALQVKDVNYRRNTVRIRHTWADDGEGGRVLGTPKNGKARTISVPGFIMQMLKRLTHGHSDDDWLFRAARGGSIWTRNWRNRVWFKAIRSAGMEDEGVTIHSLRHTYASIAIANGCDVKTLQKQLGHSSAVITLDTYSALWPERLDEVAMAVDAARTDALGLAY